LDSRRASKFGSVIRPRCTGGSVSSELPGLFLYALPQAADLYQRYSDQGLSVLGVATAFEDLIKTTWKT